MALAFVSFVAAGGFLFLGSRWMAAAAFPLAFLIFMVPLPDAAVDWLERASALASAEAAALYFAIAGTTLVRHGTVFELPGIVLEVAQECSGIRSSSGAVHHQPAGLPPLSEEPPWRQRHSSPAAFVIPLRIPRNMFRGGCDGNGCCVHVGSAHDRQRPFTTQRRPFFFALSLVPLFCSCGG